MLGVHYCSVESKWTVEEGGRFSDVIYYNIAEENNQTLDESPLEQWSAEPLITLTQSPDDTDCPATLNINVQRHYNSISIAGFYIISNARRVEISSNTHGYICTKTGESSGKGVYSTKWIRQSSRTQLQLKFVSLADKTCLKIYGMQLDMVASQSHGATGHSPLQMDKVNEMMREMDLQGTESSHALKKALELAESRQPRGLNLAASMAAVSSGCSPLLAAGGGNSNFEMAGALNSVMSVLGIAPVTDSEEQHMFSKLQNMCTLVGQHRIMQDIQPPEEGSICQAAGGQGSSSPVLHRSDLDKETMEELKSSTAKDLGAMEKRIMSAVDDKVDKLEQKLSKKLDILLEAVCKSQHNTGLD